MKINKFKEMYKKNEFNSYKGKRDRKGDWRGKTRMRLSRERKIGNDET